MVTRLPFQIDHLSLKVGPYQFGQPSVGQNQDCRKVGLMGCLQETKVKQMVLGTLLLAPFSQILISLALGIIVFHYGHKMIQVHEHG